MKIGRGTEDGVQIGPLIDDDAVDKAVRLVGDAVDEGATVADRWRSRSIGRGTFFAPTVVSGVRAGADIWREEIFGPVLGVATFDDRGGGGPAGQRHRVRPGRLRLHRGTWPAVSG